MLLVTAERITAKVTSPADKGAYKTSTIDPSIFLIINEEAEWEKACCITCIAINPGAKKLMNETPSMSPLSLPMAKDNTDKKSNNLLLINAHF